MYFCIYLVFAPWCGHCQRLEPEYEKAAKRLSGLAKLVAVDCDNQVNQQICGKYGVKGFPTLKIFGAGKKGMPMDYNYERSSDAIYKTVLSKLPSIYIKDIGGNSKRSFTLETFTSAEYVVLL